MILCSQVLAGSPSLGFYLLLAVPYGKNSCFGEKLTLWGVLLTCEQILMAIPLNTCSTDHLKTTSATIS